VRAEKLDGGVHLRHRQKSSSCRDLILSSCNARKNWK
jgi:hypothetical protein